MKRVFLIHNIPSPYRLPIFEELSKHVNLEVFFLDNVMKDRFWENELESYNFKYKYSKRKSRIGPLIYNFDALKMILRHKYDVIIIVDDLPTILNTYILILAAKIVKTRVIVWSGRFHNGTFKSKSKIAKIMLGVHNKLIYKYFSDKILAYGTATFNFLKNEGVDAEKIVVGTQVYPLSLIKFNQHLGKKKNKFVFLSICYLNKRKGVDILIRAFKEAFNHSNRYFLYIVGDGPERSNLAQMAYDNPNIIFFGNLEKEKKYEVLESCDVFVLPTLYDSWGLVINEAMEFFKPIITTNMAMGAYDLVKGNGYVVKAGNINELKEAMRKITTEDIYKMGKRSNEIIKKYNVNFVVKNFLKAIDGAV